MNDDQREIFLGWMRKIHQLEYAHRFEAISLSRWGYGLGIPALVIGSLVAAFSGIGDWDGAVKNACVAAAGVAVAVLTGLQTFVRPQSQSEKHKALSASYEQLRHKMELMLASEMEPETANERLQAILAEWSRVDAASVSERTYIKVRQKVKDMNQYPASLGLASAVGAESKHPKNQDHGDAT